MKNLLIPTLMAACFAGGALAEQRQATIEVSELTCPSCPYIAAQAVSAVDLVVIVDGVYDDAAQSVVFELTYDTEITTLAEIASASEQFGYPGRVLQNPPES
ncbi:heavy-metal-associated domain-containing protein [Parasedimentitalea psychrophila]|uniref:Periplasmic mercury ion-binding protein n=1 Tax=Parasedimentitalea psychrophila TaxID=2997337 RepID=A0A9Y2P1L7_9RHOB|nr:periplasmic mercury ion-binding protein [Parasedimentitalea psychrophila]WIY25726.1 periplasmic mercury ion-binding protein [Parasedimentitalea psychrophila]